MQSEGHGFLHAPDCNTGFKRREGLNAHDNGSCICSENNQGKYGIIIEIFYI